MRRRRIQSVIVTDLMARANAGTEICKSLKTDGVSRKTGSRHCCTVSPPFSFLLLGGKAGRDRASGQCTHMLVQEAEGRSCCTVQ